MTIKDLNPTEFDPYYSRYIEKLSDDVPLRKGFIEGKKMVIDFFRSIPAEKHDYIYDLNKWNCKEILQHLIDTERIFMYRCFRIARNDKNPLAGFDQNIYMEPSNARKKTLAKLIEEFSITRLASVSLLNSLLDSDLKQLGEANGSTMSARAAAFTIIGHEIWHMQIIKEKYL